MPFSAEDFFAVFARYNAAIWPLQVAACLAGALAVACLPARSRLATLTITLVLALMWAVNGVGYHWLHFADINPVARVFAALFVLQAFLLAATGPRCRNLRFALAADARTVAGLALIGYAAVVYPLVGRMAGHTYPAVPVFGVAPCPTTIFTVGLLLLAPLRDVRWLWPVPLAWSGIGGSAAVLLDVPQDFGLIAAGLCGLVFVVADWRGFRFARHEVPAKP